MKKIKIQYYQRYHPKIVLHYWRGCYPEDIARIMQREFTAIPSNWSVGQTIDYLRENKDLPEEF